MENIKPKEVSEPALPDLLEIMAMESEADRWRLLMEVLQEPLRQEHSALPAAWPEVDLSHPYWREIIDSRDRSLYGPAGDTLRISRIDGTVYGREKYVRDQHDRLIEYWEAVYNSSKDDPYATENPSKSAVYIAEYLSETDIPDICKLACAKYVRDEDTHYVDTYWMPPPDGGWQGIGHISAVKAWATRNIGARYVGGQLQSVYILENQPVASPQPGMGPASLLMRSVVGNFTDSQPAVIEAFERLGLYQLQAKMTLTRTRDGRLKETMDYA